jgi:heme/copper-type cytochrome/quinol oxidase subunit 2
LTHIRKVAINLILNGVICLGAGTVFVFTKVVPAISAAQQQSDAPSIDTMRMIWLFMYCSMAATWIIIGLLQIAAGISNLRLKGRTFGLIAIVGGVFTCLPTSIYLLVYGLIIYLHNKTRRAFELGEQGLGWEELQDLEARELNAPEQPGK